MTHRFRTVLLPKTGLAIKAVTLLTVVFCLVGSRANAADPTTTNQIGFSISPLVFELTANPGETLTNNVRVFNASDISQHFNMSVEAFTGNETGEATVTDNGDPAYSLNDWVTFSPKSFSLDPKAAQVITYTISIPKDAEPGGRYGSILVGTDEQKINNSTGASTVQKVGSLVLLSIRGDINYSASAKVFEPTKTLFEHNPTEFTLRFHNSSTVHIKPKGFITVSNIFGKKVADIALPEKNVLPNSDRLLDITSDKNFAIGKYTATLLANYGEKGGVITATTTFYVFPWKIGVPIIIIGLLIIIFIIRRRRNIREAIRIIFGKK